MAGGQRELDVAAALDAQRADDLERGRAQHLVFLIGERLAGRYHNAVACVDAHWVDVLHVADGDAVVRAVPHHLVLDLFPAEQRALKKHLTDRRSGEAAARHVLQLVEGVRDAAAGAPERIGGTHNGRQADALGHRARLIEVGHDLALGHRFADAEKQVAEELAVLGRADRLDGRAKRAHAEAVEHAGIGEGDGEVKAGLPAERRQQAVRPLALDDAGDDINRERLDVNGVGDALVGHDRGGV